MTGDDGSYMEYHFCDECSELLDASIMFATGVIAPGCDTLLDMLRKGLFKACVKKYGTEWADEHRGKRDIYEGL